MASRTEHRAMAVVALLGTVGIVTLLGPSLDARLAQEAVERQEQFSSIRGMN